MGTQDEDTGRHRPGFIVPPPGLIPQRPAAPTPARAPEPVALPSFRPQTAPGAPAAAPVRVWRLVLPGGARVPVTGTVLLGRNPASTDPGTEPITVDDPTSTVSKTHASVAPAGDALRVTDLYSTNGVVLVSGAGTETRLAPGGSGELAEGGALRLGDLRILAERV